MSEHANPTRSRRAFWLVLAGKSMMVLALAGMVYLLWTAWDHEAFVRWKEQAGPVPFFAVMAILPAIGFPVTPFFILAGATFGVTVGLGGSLLALLANFSLCFWLARSGFRPGILRLLERFSVKLPRFDGDHKRALSFVLMVKFTPGVPAFAKNYLLGVAGVPFALYLTVSMLVTGLYAAAFVVLGESVLEHDVNRTVIAAAVIVLAAVGFWWWRRRKAGVAGADDAGTA
ncbi:TVP38/TMEM64 family protein [Alkalisalibacterium limincola]|nr:VTT domain-containing protein [Alkalisalibacterium limincola]